MTKPFRIWIAAAGGLAVLLTAVWLFFMLGSFGFVHMAVLHWLLFASLIHLLVALGLWLCREKLQRNGTKIALVISSTMFGLATAFAFFIVSLFMAVGATTMYTSFEISRSPEGSNRMIVYVTGFDQDIIVANPMVNRWVYLRTQTHWVEARGWQFQFSPQAQWLGEQRAVLRLLDANDEELALPNGPIVVEFPQ